MNRIRPKLNKIDLKLALQNMTTRPGFVVTMFKGQWDSFLSEAYFHQDATLVELNRDRKTIAAYKLV